MRSVYGLDLYSLHTSIGAVLDYLERIDPEAAKRARARYACFDHFGRMSKPMDRQPGWAFPGHAKMKSSASYLSCIKTQQNTPGAMVASP